MFNILNSKSIFFINHWMEISIKIIKGFSLYMLCNIHHNRAINCFCTQNQWNQIMKWKLSEKISAFYWYLTWLLDESLCFINKWDVKIHYQGYFFDEIKLNLLAKIFIVWEIESSILLIYSTKVISIGIPIVE